MTLEKSEHWAKHEIPMSWCRFESEGTAWLESFEENLKFLKFRINKIVKEIQNKIF